MQVEVSKFIVSCAIDAGVDFFIGIPGVHNLRTWDFIPENASLVVQNERCTGFLALGRALKGSVSCINIIGGPGVTHAIRSLSVLSSLGAPCLILVCEKADDPNPHQLHNISNEALLNAIGISVVSLENVKDKGQQRELILNACFGSLQRPVGLVVPTNVLTQVLDLETTTFTSQMKKKHASELSFNLTLRPLENALVEVGHSMVDNDFHPKNHICSEAEFKDLIWDFVPLTLLLEKEVYVTVEIASQEAEIFIRHICNAIGASFLEKTASNLVINCNVSKKNFESQKNFSKKEFLERMQSSLDGTWFCESFINERTRTSPPQLVGFEADGCSRDGNAAFLVIDSSWDLSAVLSGIAEAFLDQSGLCIFLFKESLSTENMWESCLRALTSECVRISESNWEEKVTVSLMAAKRFGRTILFLVEEESGFDDNFPDLVEMLSVNPSYQDVVEVAKSLIRSKNPVLYMGRGSVHAKEEVKSLAERLTCKVFTTFSGRGLIDETDDRFWGWASLPPTCPQEVTAFFNSSDCILVVGARMSELATGHFRLSFSDKQRFLVDIAPDAGGPNHSSCKFIRSDSKAFLKLLLTCLDELHVFLAGRPENSVGFNISPRSDVETLIWEVGKVFGPDKIFTTDSGNGTILAAEWIRVNQNGGIFSPTDYSCMGFSVPSAFGACVSREFTIAIPGDGAFLMTGPQALFFCQGVVCVILLNDGKYGMMSDIQKNTRRQERGVTLPKISFAEIAKAAGVSFYQASDASTLRKIFPSVIKDLKARSKVLIDCNISYTKLSFFSSGVFSNTPVALGPSFSPWSERVSSEISRIESRFEMLHIWRVWEMARQKFSNSLFFEEGASRMTYLEADMWICGIISTFQRCGFKEGEVVAIISQNSVFVILLHFALAALNGIVLNVNTRLSVPEMRFILENSRASWIYSSNSLIDLASKSGDSVAWRGWCSFESISVLENPARNVIFEKKSSCDVEIESRDTTKPFQLYYTSGTTGKPKGVLLSHQCVFLHCVGVCEDMNLNQSDRWAHVSPMFHLVDAFAIYAVSLVGGCHIILPQTAPNRLLQSLVETKSTCCNVAASLGNFVVEFHRAQKVESSLRVISFGGSALDKAVVKELISILGCEIFMSYGMTECCGKISMSLVEKNISDDVKIDQICTSGKPFKLMDVRISDDKGGDHVGVPGEVLIRGPTVFIGYLNDNESTQNSFVEGWFKTGDIAIMRDDGYLVVCDRKKDMILCNSENVYSLEVEKVLMQHPAVFSACVFGYPDKIAGELVKAVVQMRETFLFNPSELRMFCHANLADYKVPQIIEQIDIMPMTGSGKIAKAAFRVCDEILTSVYHVDWISEGGKESIQLEKSTCAFFGEHSTSTETWLFNATNCDHVEELSCFLLRAAKSVFEQGRNVKHLRFFCRPEAGTCVSAFCNSLRAEWHGDAKCMIVNRTDKGFMLSSATYCGPESCIKILDDGAIMARRLVRKVGSLVPRSIKFEEDIAIITGGTGDLGMALTNFLIDKWSCKNIVLLSRKASSHNQNFKDLKATVILIDCDVSDLNALGDALSPFIQKSSALFHLAGEGCDETLREISQDRFQEIVSGKAKGAENLDKITRFHKNISKFVLFSSFVVEFEAPRTSHMSFGSSYLDLIHKKRVAEGFPSSIYFWANILNLGMVHRMGSSVQQFWRMQGLHYVTHQEVFQAMEVFLANDVHDAFFFKADWEHFSGGPKVVFSELTPKEVQVMKTVNVVKKVITRQEVFMELEEILNDVAPQFLGPLSEMHTFGEIGIQSVGSIQIWQRVNKKFNSEFSATIVYDYPQVGDFVSYVTKELTNEDDSSEQAPPKSVLSKEESERNVVVSGIACRFARSWNPDSLWECFYQGIDEVSVVPSSRWNWVDVYSENPGENFKTISKWGCFFEGISMFDPLFFNISKREAFIMDPQQRMLLECAVEAIEDGECHLKDLVSPNRVDVYVGIQNSEYARRVEKCTDKQFLGTGGSLAIASGRISYFFNLTGSSLAIDTACSSSLVTFNYSERAISNGLADKALSFGVACMAWPETTINFSLAGMLSPDGRCKSFDASANGYVRGEGCGGFLLEVESDAKVVNSLVRSTSVNQDGRSAGLTAPSGPSQESLIEAALKRGRISNNEIMFIEAHGTGTALGDPIEMNALFRKLGHQRDSPMMIGCSKTNLGHCETAAGAVGLLKLILCIRFKIVSKNLLFSTINPFIGFQVLEGMSSVFPLENVDWNQQDKTCAVSSFGFSGTNSHCILSSSHERFHEMTVSDSFTADSFTVSAVSASCLKKHMQKLGTYLIESNTSLSSFADSLTRKMQFQSCRVLKENSKKLLANCLGAQLSLSRTTRIPYCSFDRSAFWLDGPKSSESEVIIQQNFESVINLSDSEKIIEICVNRTYEVQDHLVFGVPVMPGACHLSFVTNHLIEHFNFHSVRLSNIIILEPVIVSTSETKLIYRYDLSKGNVEASSSSLHSAKFFRSLLKDSQPKHVAFEQWKTPENLRQCSGELIWDSKAAGEGVKWGGSFRWIEKFSVENEKGECHLVRPHSFKGKFLVSPEIIDSMFQGSLMFLDDRLPRPFLAPFTVDSFTVTEKVDETQGISCMILLKNLEKTSIETDGILRQNNAAKVSFEKFTMVHASKDLFLRNISGKKPSHGSENIYEITWTREKTIKASEKNYDNDDWKVYHEDLFSKNFFENEYQRNSIFFFKDASKSSPTFITRVMSSKKPTLNRVVIVTKYAVKLSPMEKISPWATALWACCRCIMAETDPSCRITLLDVESRSREESCKNVAAWCSCKIHCEHALRNDEVFSSSMRHLTPAISDLASFELFHSGNGTFQSLNFRHQLPESSMGVNDILMRVHASALNFRDVLIILDMYPEKGSVPVGLELSGTVLNADSRNLVQIAEEVFGLCNKSFVAIARTQIQLVRRKPRNLSHEEAAALPLVMCTCVGSFEFLPPRAKSALIHAVSGGVGVAASMMGKAQFSLPRIFGTAGSVRKKKFSISWGVDFVLNSRITDFSENILYSTGGVGVDFVLNSLTSSNFVERSVHCLAENGSFVELGQRDIWTKEQFESARPDARYEVYVLERVWKTEPEKIGLMLDTIRNAYELDVFRPLPATRYPIHQAKAAFQHMFEARHIGKIVFYHPISFDEAMAGSACVISGAYGGLGGILLNQVSRRSNVIALGRSTKSVKNPSSPLFAIELIQVDVARYEDMQVAKALSTKAGSSKYAIFHLAGLLRDGFMSQLDFKKDWAPVLEVKISGLKNMLQIFSNSEFVCLYSSVTSFTGFAGQTNYGTANGFLDGYSQYKGRNKGFISINWGPWSDVGMFSRLDKRLQRGKTLKPSEQENLLKCAWDTGVSHCGVLNVDWREAGCHSELTRKLFEDTLKTFEPSGDKKKIPISQFVEKSVRQIAGLLDEDILDKSAPLREIGFDSMLSVEIRACLMEEFGIQLPSTLLYDFPSTEAIVDHIKSLVGSEESESCGTEQRVSEDFKAATTVESQKISSINSDLLMKKTENQKKKEKGKKKKKQRLSKSLKLLRKEVEFLSSKLNSLTGFSILEDLKNEIQIMPSIEGISIRVGKNCNIEQLSNQFIQEVCQISQEATKREMISDHDSRLNFSCAMINVYSFDANHFSISRREAVLMSPQQRILMETSWHAIEDAGMLPLETGLGCRASIAIGAGPDGYNERFNDIELFSASGSLLAALSGRLAYIFDFQGPCVSIDTACSSTHMAIEFVCKSFKESSDAGLAGGVNLILSKKLWMDRLSLLSSNGRCRPFDDAADGYVRGEACGVFFLKKDPSLSSKGQICSIFSAQSGAGEGFMVPTISTQARLLNRAELCKSNLYIPQGTSSKVADSAELTAVIDAHKSSKPLLVTSWKTFFGHAEMASGVVSIASIFSYVRSKKVSKHLFFELLNSNVGDMKGIVLANEDVCWSSHRTSVLGVGASGSLCCFSIEPKIESGKDHEKLFCLSCVPFSKTSSSALIREGIFNQMIESVNFSQISVPQLQKNYYEAFASLNASRKVFGVETVEKRKALRLVVLCAGKADKIHNYDTHLKELILTCPESLLKPSFRNSWLATKVLLSACVSIESFCGDDSLAGAKKAFPNKFRQMEVKDISSQHLVIFVGREVNNIKKVKTIRLLSSHGARSFDVNFALMHLIPEIKLKRPSLTIFEASIYETKFSSKK